MQLPALLVAIAALFIASPASAAVIQIRVDFYDANEAFIGWFEVTYDDQEIITYPEGWNGFIYPRPSPAFSFHPLLAVTTGGAHVIPPTFIWAPSPDMYWAAGEMGVRPGAETPTLWPMTYRTGQVLGYLPAPCTLAAATRCFTKYEFDLATGFFQGVETRSLVTPLPAAAWLFAIGLGGFATIRARSKKFRGA